MRRRYASLIGGVLLRLLACRRGALSSYLAFQFGENSLFFRGHLSLRGGGLRQSWHWLDRGSSRLGRWERSGISRHELDCAVGRRN